MKNAISALLVIVVGSIIGFYGVLVSVFSDSTLSKRLVTILIILLIFIILSLLLGFFNPVFSWRWGLFLASPGAILLSLYFIREPELYIIVYIVVILGVSSLSSRFGSYLKERRKT